MSNFPHTSSTVNMQIMNQFYTHSQKKQNPAKKFIKSGQIEIAQRRRRWDRAGEVRSVRSSDERCDRRSRSTRGAIDERARRTIAPLVDRRARSQSRLTRGTIDERARRTIALLVDCRLSLLACRTIAPLVDHRLSLLPLSLSLSDLGSLFSLSLSLSPEMIWTENKSIKLFPGQRSKYWSTRNEFLENFIFHCSQTCGFGGKWFPEIIFIQNKRSLSYLYFLINLQTRPIADKESNCQSLKKKNQTVRIIKNQMDYMLKVSVFFFCVCNLYTCSKLLYVF